MTTCIVDISESTDHIAQVMESSYLSLGEFNCIMTELIYRISLSTYAESNLMNYVSELKDKYNLKQLGLGDYIAGLKNDNKRMVTFMCSRKVMAEALIFRLLFQSG